MKHEDRTLIAAALHVVNHIPNRKIEGMPGGFKDTYALASALHNRKNNNQPEFNTLIQFNSMPVLDCQIDNIEVEAIHDDGENAQRTAQNGSELEIHYWSVYAHRVDGGVICLADCKNKEAAIQLYQLLIEIMLKGRKDSEFINKADKDHLGSFSVNH